MSEPSLPQVETLYQNLLEQVRGLIKSRDAQNTHLLGVYSGGAWLAQRLHKDLGLQTEAGFINTSLYRDDFRSIGLHPQTQPTEINFAIDNKDIILVDDILYTGRSVRAAMNQIFDYGRPATISLAVLIDRGGRQLPVQPDACGGVHELPQDLQFDLTLNEQHLFDIALKRTSQNDQSPTESAG